MQKDDYDNSKKQIDPQIDQAEAATPNGGGVPATAPKTPDVVPPGYKLVDPYDEYTEREGGEVFFAGDYLNFNGQTGRWTRGKNKDEIDAEEPFLCHIYGLVVGWIKRDNYGKISQDGRRLGYVRNGYKPEPIEGLPDRDERHWPLGRDGKRRTDPWRKITYLPMRDQEGNDVVYGAESNTARSAIAQFVRVIRGRPDRGGREPKVLLGSRFFDNTSGSITYVPDLKFCDWDYWDGPEPEVSPIAVSILPPVTTLAKTATVKALPLPSRDDMDDEIPF